MGWRLVADELGRSKAPVEEAPEPQPTPEEVPEQTEVKLEPPGTPDLDLRGASGRPFPDDIRHIRAEGLPPRPTLARPPGDPEEWERNRKTSQQTWAFHSRQAAATHLSSSDLPIEKQDAANEALNRALSQISEMRARIEAGEITPREGRLEMDRIRTEARAEFVSIVGEGEAERLHAALDAVYGGAPF